MKANKPNDSLPYLDIFQNIKAIQRMIFLETKKSPTIAEIAEACGHSEELVLECLEYGQPNIKVPTYYH